MVIMMLLNFVAICHKRFIITIYHRIIIIVHTTRTIPHTRTACNKLVITCQLGQYRNFLHMAHRPGAIIPVLPSYRHAITITYHCERSELSGQIKAALSR